MCWLVLAVCSANNRGNLGWLSVISPSLETRKEDWDLKLWFMHLRFYGYTKLLLILQWWLFSVFCWEGVSMATQMSLSTHFREVIICGRWMRVNESPIYGFFGDWKGYTNHCKKLGLLREILLHFWKLKQKLLYREQRSLVMGLILQKLHLQVLKWIVYSFNGKWDLH